jgi:type IV protein arginine methyltransferase
MSLDIENEELDDLEELGHSLIASIFNRLPLPKIRSMVESGAPLWYQDEDGTSALHAAVYVEDESIVRYLIDNGAVWNTGTCFLSVLSSNV